MFTSIKAFILAIILFFINIPYGPDAPTRALIQSSSLDSSPVVCAQSEQGAAAEITFTMKQDYRAIPPDYDMSYYFRVKLFDSMDGIDMSLSGKPYEDFQVIDKYSTDEEVQYKLSWSIEITEAPDIIKVGDTFTLALHLKIDPSVPAGTYHLAVAPNYSQEVIYPSAIVIN